MEEKESAAMPMPCARIVTAPTVSADFFMKLRRVMSCPGAGGFSGFIVFVPWGLSN